MTEEQHWPDPVYLTKDHAINMTLRDYFAAKAMQAITPSFANANILNPAEFISDKAYALADAMLKAREQ